MISRRHLLALLLALLASGALAQAPEAMRRIGVLSLVPREHDPRLEHLRDALAKSGYVEGRNLSIEWRSSDDHPERLPALVSGLLERRVEVIVAAHTQAVEAARRQTSTVPIVFVAAFDPVGSGFAKSLARPGLNMTGISNNLPNLAPRQLDLIAQSIPRVARVGVVLNPRNRATPQARRDYEEAATRMDFELSVIQAGTAEQLLAVARTARSLGVQALIVQADSTFLLASSALIETLAAQRLPALFTQVQHVEAGGLMSYGPDITENYRRAAVYVDRILKGARPADLPIEPPSRLELCINLKAAEALGLTLSPDFLKQADRVLK